MLNILVIIIVLLFGSQFFKFFIGQLDSRDQKVLQLMFWFHFLWSIFFFFFVIGDANYYWDVASKLNYKEFLYYLFEDKGTYFIFALSYFPAGYLGLSYFTGTVIYGLIGYIGFVFFYLVILKIIPFNSKFKGYTLFPIILFMPNLHFWTAGVGKDALIFFSIGAFSYALLHLQKRFLLLFLSMGLTFLVRPHIILMLLVSFAIAFLIDGRTKMIRKVFLSAILVLIIIIILPSVIKYVNLENSSFESIAKQGAKQAEMLADGSGSKVDISSYPFILKIFTFLYRPLFFDINGVPAVFASIENFLWLILSIRVIRNKPIRTFKAAPIIVKGLMLFFIIGAFFFSISLGNLGIMIRMKNMLLPGLLIFILWSFSYKQQLAVKLRNI